MHNTQHKKCNLKTNDYDEAMLSILLLCDNDRRHANTILEHINAFRKFSKHDVYLFNPRGNNFNKCIDLNEFDVVVIHYSLVIISDHYLAPDLREKIRYFKGLKIQFIQDDYRWVDKISEMMRYLGINVLFTLVPKDQISAVWEERLPGVAKYNTLAGYIPDDIGSFETVPIESRLVDVGYRGRLLPHWLGWLSQEKVWIAQGFLERSAKYGLRCDIAWREEDRIYGRDWYRFISSCKATLGTESGASIADFDGTIEQQVKWYLQVKKYLMNNSEADFFEVHREVLEPHEGNVMMNVISPRVFEAISLGTALILFPGEYMGIIKPWAHYIPLEKDFSNMAEVVEKLRDTSFLQEMTERAYADVVESNRYSLRTFIEEFDDVVTKFGKRYGKQFKIRYRFSKFERYLYQCFKPLMKTLVKVFRRLGVCISLKEMLKNPVSRMLLFQHVLNRRAWREVALKGFLRELVLLDFLRRFRLGGSSSINHFRIFTIHDREKKKLVFVSQPDSDAIHLNMEGDFKNHVIINFTWSDLEYALNNGNVEQMLWDHSSIDTTVKYPISKSRYITINVGSNGVEKFDSLINLIKKIHLKK
jgi:hypothetical protein